MSRNSSENIFKDKMKPEVIAHLFDYWDRRYFELL